MGISVALTALACLAVVACVVSVGIMTQNARRKRGTLKEALDDLRGYLKKRVWKGVLKSQRSAFGSKCSRECFPTRRAK